MSPSGPGKFTAAALSDPAGKPYGAKAGGVHDLVQPRAESHSPLATKPQSSRRGMTAAQVGPSRRPDRHWYNDPCNYLG